VPDGDQATVAPQDVTGLAGSVRASLERVADPCCRERGVSVVDMGLLERLEVDEDGLVRIDLVLTSGWCPFQVDLLREVTAAAKDVPGVVDADVRITLDEVWSRSRLSDLAHRRLTLLPEPGEVTDRDAYLSRRSAPAPDGGVSPSAQQQEDTT
jgi:metal-sulfur cluster biosynthetic enzyme